MRPKRKIPTKTKAKQKLKMKQGKVAIRIKDHPPGSDGSIGHHERHQAMVKRAVELKQKDYTHWEIAELLFQEFNLESVPSISTVSGYLDAAYRATDEQIKTLQWQWRLSQFKDLDRLRKKWMALALAEQGEIQMRRHVKTADGDDITTLDEDCVEEQLKATNALVKIMARQARLFGLDLEQAEKGKDGGVMDVNQLYVWIVAQITSMQPGSGAPIEEGGITLELSSGIDGI